MRIAFWDNQLGERGTTVSVYDYAHYNEELLHNKSYIFYEKNNGYNNKKVIEKFKNRFIVHAVDNFKDVDDYLLKYNIKLIYIQKYGTNDKKLSKVARNCVHCVFSCHEPHGEIYSAISNWISGNEGKYPVVPYMINLPKHNKNMRKELNIPENAIVFGGYGGSSNFDIPCAINSVYNVAKKNPNIYFLFANFNKFCKELPNIIHLPKIIDLDKKVEFINTSDAMLWARKSGETFGLAIGEFSTLNKPVIATKKGCWDKAHIHLLGDKAFWYSNEEDLTDILLSFNPEIESKKDWNAYREYTPKKVMKKFKEIYIDDNINFYKNIFELIKNSSNNR